MSYGSVCVCLWTLLALGSAYPSQIAETACRDMTPKGPGHNNAVSQETQIPSEFSVTVDSNKIRPNDEVVITIVAEGRKSIAGLMVQVRKANSDVPLGTFTPKSANVKTVGCSAENDTASHNDPSPKKKIVMTWAPPANSKGKHDIYCTIAATKTEFWAKRKCATVTVV